MLVNEKHRMPTRTDPTDVVPISMYVGVSTVILKLNGATECPSHNAPLLSDALNLPVPNCDVEILVAIPTVHDDGCILIVSSIVCANIAAVRAGNSCRSHQKALSI